MDIRRFYRDYEAEESDDENDYSAGPSVPDDSVVIKPTREGVSLRVQDGADVWKLIDVVNGEFPDLAVSLPCYYGEDHNSQKDALRCSECLPFSAGAMACLMK